MRCIEEVLKDRKLKAGPALRKIKGIVMVAKSELPSWPNTLVNGGEPAAGQTYSERTASI